MRLLFSQYWGDRAYTIDAGQRPPGQKPLINGAGGGVGTLGVKIANAIGVKDVTGVDLEHVFI